MRKLFLLLLLAACQSKPEPVIVKVPVMVPCVHKVAEPDWKMVQLAQDASAFHKLQALLVDRELSKGYIGELKAELLACS